MWHHQGRPREIKSETLDMWSSLFLWIGYDEYIKLKIIRDTAEASRKYCIFGDNQR
jgi:hypothetical protein